jgi:hypothetical protein
MRDHASVDSHRWRDAGGIEKEEVFRVEVDQAVLVPLTDRLIVN